ncbi:Gamma-tubulin complex component [Paramyrothecium foliicola]|nr:Gamma-tubulin complex component [Paramyrothecium foliicola]
MADKDAEADVFAVPNFWQTSQWLETLSEQHNPPFFSRDAGSDDNKPSGFFSLGPVATEQDGFFKLPALSVKEKEAHSSAPNEAAQVTLDHPEASQDGDSEDVWSKFEDFPKPSRVYRTWEDFLSQNQEAHQPAFISEAGPTVYDALLRDNSDPLGFSNTQVPTVRTEVYFSSLLAMALGYESVLFTKDVQTSRFKPVIPVMRISGYSKDVLQHVETQCLACGSTFITLRGFLQSAYAERATRCGVALASAIAEVLRAVQEHVAMERKDPRSLLQLQSTVRGVMIVLGPLRTLANQLNSHTSDEDLIMLCFEQASVADFNNDDACPEIIREVLQRVSRPWIEFMEEWIGTRREDGIPLAKSNVGQTRGFVKVESQAYVDDFGEELEEVDFRLDETKIPKFLPDELAETIFETGCNLRFIRSCHPNNALARADMIQSSRPPWASWLFTWDDISRLESRVESYRNNLMDTIEQFRINASQSCGSIHGLLKDERPIGIFEIDKAQIEQQLQASMDELSKPVRHVTKDDSLKRIVQQRLRAIQGVDATGSTSTPRWSLLPILSFGGIVSAQARVINRESLRLLFKEHDLRKHLRIQRDFQMLGNGNFCSRLSQALFDPEMETAERQQGTVRVGAVMGLRLGGRDTWPPASSELRLALMGVLADAHKLQMAPAANGQLLGSTDLPGDLSFAVRDLPPEEIDLCMNADSLEALDFLRLSYKSPAALTHIITPVALMQYDRIFKHLLRLLRMLYVVNQLFRDVTGKGAYADSSEGISNRFAFEAHHFVCAISSYFMDSGVAIPWQKFEERLAGVEADLSSSNSTIDVAPDKLDSPSRLQDYHLHIIDQILRALFLKKRQQPILNLLDDVFRVVLLFVKQTRFQMHGKHFEKSLGANETAQLYKDFRKKVQLFTTVCRRLTEKSPTSNRKTEAGQWIGDEGMGDESKIAQLLLKLDMSGYYSKREP